DAPLGAEGVETPTQLEVVRALGIRAGQGYLLSRPARDVRDVRIDPDALIASADPDEDEGLPPAHRRTAAACRSGPGAGLRAGRDPGRTVLLPGPVRAVALARLRGRDVVALADEAVADEALAAVAVGDHHVQARA